MVVVVSVAGLPRLVKADFTNPCRRLKAVSRISYLRDWWVRHLQLHLHRFSDGPERLFDAMRSSNSKPSGSDVICLNHSARLRRGVPRLAVESWTDPDVDGERVQLSRLGLEWLCSRDIFRMLIIVMNSASFCVVVSGRMEPDSESQRIISPSRMMEVNSRSDAMARIEHNRHSVVR